MNVVKVVKSTPMYYQSIRAAREIELELNGFNELSYTYILIISHSGIPEWLLKVDSYVVKPISEGPVTVRVLFERAVWLLGAWTDVSQVVKTQELLNGGNYFVDAEALMGLGEDICGGENVPAQHPLMVAEAAERLSWTYGVEKENVKISICL